MEKNFEIRKREYLDRLRNNIELIETMKFNEKNPGDALKMKEMVLDPKNEEELITAIFTLDYTDLIARATTGDVKTILPKDNFYLKLLAEMIDSLKKSEDVEHIIEKVKNNQAKFLYGFIVGLMADLDTSINYLAEVTDYDLYDELDIAQFQLYLEKANSIFNRDSDNQEGITFVGPSNRAKIEESIIRCNEFHTLCENGKLENNKKSSRKQNYRVRK